MIKISEEDLSKLRSDSKALKEWKDTNVQERRGRTPNKK